MRGSRLARILRIGGAGLAGLMLLGAVAHGIVWWQATEALARESARWIAARAAEGIAVRHSTPQRGGWPFAARLTLPAVEAEGTFPVQGQGPVPMRLALGSVALEIQLRDPERLRIALSGPMHLRAAGTDAARAQAETFEIAVPLRRDAAAPAQMQARALALQLGADRFAAEQVSLWLTRDAMPRAEAASLAIRLAASGVQLPAQSRPALGERVARAELDLQVIGQVPPGLSPHAQAVAWRDAGGYLQVPRLLLDWGPLSLSADATLALDAAVQPSGAGRARMAGLGPTLEVLANAGLVPRQTAQMGRSMVAFMQRTPAGGGPPVVELPLTLQNRVLSAGRITLLHLPPLALPR